MAEFESLGLGSDFAEACARLGSVVGSRTEATAMFSERYLFFIRYCQEVAREPSGWEECYEGRTSEIVENQTSEACRSDSLSMLFCLSDAEHENVEECDAFRPRESCDPTAPSHFFMRIPEGFGCDFRGDTYQFSGDSVKQVIAVTCVGASGQGFEIECDPPNDVCSSNCRCFKNADSMRKLTVENVHADEFLETPLEACGVLGE